MSKKPQYDPEEIRSVSYTHLPTDALRGVPSKRHAVPEAWPPPTKFRNGIWGVGQVVVPYGFAGDEGSGRRVVGPYGCCLLYTSRCV